LPSSSSGRRAARSPARRVGVEDPPLGVENAKDIGDASQNALESLPGQLGLFSRFVLPLQEFGASWRNIFARASEEKLIDKPSMANVISGTTLPKTPPPRPVP